MRKHTLDLLSKQFLQCDFSDIEDAVQSALEKWIAKVPHPAMTDRYQAQRWILIVSKNFILDQLRRDKRKSYLSDEYELYFTGKSPETLLAEHDQIDIAFRKLSSRSYAQHVAVMLHDWYDRSMKNVAGNLGCSENAARIHHLGGVIFPRFKCMLSFLPYYCRGLFVPATQGLASYPN